MTYYFTLLLFRWVGDHDLKDSNKCIGKLKLEKES